MSLHRYGVLKGKAIASQQGVGASPHFQIHIVDDTHEYRIAINVKSQLAPSELLYAIVDDFQHPITELHSELPLGFTELACRPGSGALDYIRGNLFDWSALRVLPYSVPGPDNDLNDKISAYVQRAIADELAEVYAFGERWGPENDKRDRYFGFLPGNGVHDIHMNQGNAQRYRDDDGVWQDGGLLIHFPEIRDESESVVWSRQWVALFLAFQSQARHTDDQTGHRLGDAPSPTPIPEPTQPAAVDGRVRIVAALVNPEGGDVGLETVTVLNTTPEAIDLRGWSIVDKNKKRETLDSVVVAPGDTQRITLSGDGAQLSNDGGAISLLDPEGLKVHGVSYTRAQAQRSRWTIVFCP